VSGGGGASLTQKGEKLGATVADAKCIIAEKIDTDYYRQAAAKTTCTRHKRRILLDRSDCLLLRYTIGNTMPDFCRIVVGHDDDTIKRHISFF